MKVQRRPGKTGISCRLSLACRAQDFSQPLSHDHFFARLDGHRNEFDVILFLKLLWVWLFHALAHGSYHARIVHPEHFDHRIALAELFYAIRDSETPGFLVPG